MKHKLFIIDALAPFFIPLPENHKYNWSKIPFALLENDGVVDPVKSRRILEAFEQYVKKITVYGYTAISLDDIAHLVPHHFYPASLIKKIRSYQHFYKQLFSIAQKYAIKVFINSDIMFFNEAIDAYTERKYNQSIRVFMISLRYVLACFPSLSGVIIRCGETDGIDVSGDFKSRLLIRTPPQCRRMIRKLLVICERYNRLLVVRTWTLGAFEIGDLIWNKKTYDAVFENITSDHLIISMKYGEADFFKFLNFNPLFFHSNHQKIIELQTRREYEGFGEFPSFAGNDYEKYARYCSLCENVVGIHVWCQTGGWSHFTRLTFLRRSSLWNEINTFCTIKIFKENLTAETAVIQFVQLYLPGKNPDTLITLLKLSERIIRELWYMPEFSSKRIYFRRSRVPPLLWIFWDSILINHSLRKIIRRFVHERQEAIHDGYRMLHKIKKMREYAFELDFDTSTFTYQYDTFKIIALSREYYLGKWNPAITKKIIQSVTEYRKKYPCGFNVIYDFSPVHFKKWLIKTIFRISLRQHPHYRILDRIFLIKFASLIYLIFRIWEKRRLPAFAQQQAMGIHVLFK